MSDLFLIYQYAFFLCIICGLTLSTQGAFMVARGESLQILALAQSALAGSLIGRLLLETKFEAVKILFFSWSFLFLTKFLFLKLARHKLREPFFIAIYLILMSFCFLLISLFPALESHMAIGLFGDIVSLDQTSTLICIGIFGLLTTLLWGLRKELIRTTFEKTVLGVKKIYWRQEILFTVILALSLYNMGLLFTVATMTLPVILIGEKGRSLKQVFFLMGITAIFSSVLGLATSIWHSRLSTVPTQIFFQLGISLLFRLFYWHKGR